MNMNDYCWVKLTDFGWQVHAEFYENLDLDPERYKAILLDDSTYQAEHHGQAPGWVRFQIYEMAHIFGPWMYNGAYYVPFDGNEILFERPKS